jgi:hypothetical protein
MFRSSATAPGNCSLRCSTAGIHARVVTVEALVEFAVQQLLRERHALEFHQVLLGVRVARETKAHRPRARERLRILERRRVIDGVRSRERVTLDDLERCARVIAGSIEPRHAVETRHVDDKRVAIPARVRDTHPAIDRRGNRRAEVHDARGARELIRDEQVIVGMEDLQRVGHVIRARHAGQEALQLGVLLEAILIVAPLLLGRGGQVRDLVAIDDAVTGRRREQRSVLGRPRARAVRQHVPVGRREGLPYAAQIRLAVGEPWYVAGVRTPLSAAVRAEQQSEGEQ